MIFVPLKKFGLNLKTILFDEDVFIKNELNHWANLYPISEPFIAFDMARIAHLDGAVVMGCGDLVLESFSNEIVSIERGALFQAYDFIAKENRAGCYQFFQGSAEIMLAFLERPLVYR